MTKILRKSDIEDLTGLNERVLRDMERDGNFPRRFTINPGGKAVGWLANEIEDWVIGRAASRGAV